MAPQKVIAAAIRVLGLSVFFLLSAIPQKKAEATLITYDSTNIGGNSWQYDYTVVNDTLGSALEEFTIFFDVGSYDSVTIVGTPVGWDGIAIEPDPGIPDDGFGDYLALTGGLTSGGAQSGFQISFRWLLTGIPGGQTFTVVDPITFETLESGTTSASISQPPTSVPEPTTLSLLLGGLATGWVVRRRRYCQPQEDQGAK